MWNQIRRFHLCHKAPPLQPRSPASTVRSPAPAAPQRTQIHYSQILFVK